MERRELIVDAALQVVADGGLKGLTHRAVDRRAGLVEGSTGNHFPRRSELVHAIIVRLGQRDREIFEQIQQSHVTAIDELAELLAHGVTTMASPEYAPIARVRLAIMPTHPEAAGQFHWRVLNEIEETLEALGLDHRPARARAVFAFFDGMIFQSVSVDPRPIDLDAVRHIFRLLITQSVPEASDAPTAPAGD